MTATRKPPMWLACISGLLFAASVPVDGLAGIALSVLALVCGIPYMVLNRRFTRGGTR